MNPIKISIIIPCYNQEKYIEGCIESIIEQPSASCEIIVIDDGSTDKTPEILREYEKKEKEYPFFHISTSRFF